MSKQYPFNLWGYVHSFTIENFPISMPSRERYGDFEFIADVGTIDLSISAPATPQILKAITRWARNGRARLPIWTEEWLCLYCGSPNPLPITHCDQCGAPRSWILG